MVEERDWFRESGESGESCESGESGESCESGEFRDCLVLKF